MHLNTLTGKPCVPAGPYRAVVLLQVIQHFRYNSVATARLLDCVLQGDSLTIGDVAHGPFAPGVVPSNVVQQEMS